MSQFELIDDNTFAKQIDENTFEFVKFFTTKELSMDEEDIEYFAVSSIINSPNEDIEYLIKYSKTERSLIYHEKPLSETEANLAFARCYYLFEESYIGNEDWNQGYSSYEEMCADLQKKFNINIEELSE